MLMLSEGLTSSTHHLPYLSVALPTHDAQNQGQGSTNITFQLWTVMIFKASWHTVTPSQKSYKVYNNCKLHLVFNCYIGNAIQIFFFHFIIFFLFNYIFQLNESSVFIIPDNGQRHKC